MYKQLRQRSTTVNLIVVHVVCWFYLLWEQAFNTSLDFYATGVSVPGY